jgi:hypothetical protein
MEDLKEGLRSGVCGKRHERSCGLRQEKRPSPAAALATSGNRSCVALPSRRKFSRSGAAARRRVEGFFAELGQPNFSFSSLLCAAASLREYSGSALSRHLRLSNSAMSRRMNRVSRTARSTAAGTRFIRELFDILFPKGKGTGGARPNAMRSKIRYRRSVFIRRAPNPTLRWLCW